MEQNNCSASFFYRTDLIRKIWLRLSSSWSKVILLVVLACIDNLASYLFTTMDKGCFSVFFSPFLIVSKWLLRINLYKVNQNNHILPPLVSTGKFSLYARNCNGQRRIKKRRNCFHFSGYSFYKSKKTQLAKGMKFILPFNFRSCVCFKDTIKTRRLKAKTSDNHSFNSHLLFQMNNSPS